MIDEFQNINRYIYRDEACERNYDETMAGSYHEVSESKVAPMLVTGSYVGWLVQVISQYLEGGRLKLWKFSPYLTEEEGLEAVFQYANLYQEPITNITALTINELCMADPFFIASVVQSEYEERDLTTKEGVIATVNYELSNRDAEMAKTWEEYINSSLDRINDRNGKNILLHLSKHADRPWNHLELKEELKLDMEPKLSHLTGKVAEDMFATELRTKKRIRASKYFAFPTKEKVFGKEETEREVPHHEVKLNLIDVRTRQIIKRPDGKNMELDVIAQSDCGRILLIEVRKRKENATPNHVEDFLEKVKLYAEQTPDHTIIPAFYSAAGFTEKAEQFCEDNKIGTGTELTFFMEELNQNPD